MTRSFFLRGAAFAAALSLSGVASAQLAPPPPPEAAKTQAVPYLDTAGMSDVYEITSSEIALQKSQNPQIRQMATRLIADHTLTTNLALKAAKAGGVMAPPPVLNTQFRGLIAELNQAAPGDFDRIYLGQQLPAHQGALDLHSSYAANGDVASLRAVAKGAVPIVRGHLDMLARMQGGSMAGM